MSQTASTPWQFRDAGRGGVLLAAIVLAAAFMLHGAELLLLSRFNGLYIDELTSLVITEPAQNFGRAFTERIITDGHPPLYYFALYAVRKFIADDGSASLVLNLLATLAAAMTVVWSSWRARVLPCGLLAVAAFLLTGPVLRFTLEVRTYLIAINLVFVAAWFCGLAVQVRRPPPAIGFCITGIIGALLHPFATLICVSLAFGTMTVALIDRRDDLWRYGLSLSISSLVIFAVWSPFGLATAHKLSWIIFDRASVIQAIEEVGELAVGGTGAASKYGLLLFGIVLCAGFLTRVTRSLTVAFGVALGVFALLPILISYRLPIIVGRYWTIGYPVVVVLTVLLCATWFFEGLESRRHRALLVAAGVAAGFIVMSDEFGFAAARVHLSYKKIWRGAPVVAAFASRCPAGSIHVLLCDAAALC